MERRNFLKTVVTNFVKIIGLTVFIPKVLFGNPKKQRIDWSKYVNPCPSAYNRCEGRGESPRLFCYAYTKESCYVMSNRKKTSDKGESISEVRARWKG